MRCVATQEMGPPSMARVPQVVRRQQAVITHADAEAARNPPHHDGHDEGFPGEEKYSGKCTEVKTDHDEYNAPVNRLRESFVVL